jgi:polar amino acid transport system substrate-binding protein
LQKILMSLFLIALPSFLSAAPDDAQEPCHLTVAWEEWYPLIYREFDGELAGSEYRIISKLAKDSGCTLDFVARPWGQSLEELAAGKVDMLYGATYTQERDVFAQFSKPYRLEDILLALSSDDKGVPPQVSSISLEEWLNGSKDGDPRVLGVVEAYFYGDSVEKIIRDPLRKKQLLAKKFDQDLHRELKSNQIDAYLVESEITNAQVGLPLRRLKIKEYSPEPLSLMFSNKVPGSIVDRFDSAIDKAEAAKASK